MLHEKRKKRDRCADAVDAVLLQRAQHAVDRFAARAGVADQFREHRIVVDRHGVAGIDAVVVADAGTLRQFEMPNQPRRWREVPRRILGIHAALDGMAVRREIALRNLQFFAARNAKLRFDEIDAPDHLGDRVLDLQSRIHLEEVELFVRSHEAFDRSGRVVVDGSRRLHRHRAETLAQFLIDDRRRTLLDDFLMPTLQRAFALANMNDVAVLVAEDLHFNVPRRGDEFLRVDSGIAEE